MASSTTPINTDSELESVPSQLRPWAASRVGYLDLKRAQSSSQDPMVYTLVDIDSHKAMRCVGESAPVAGWWNTRTSVFEADSGTRTDVYGINR